MRRLLIAVLAVTALLTTAGTAFGHAYLVSSSPTAEAKLSASPALVTVTFNEPVELLRSQDAEVVDQNGAAVSAGRL